MDIVEIVETVGIPDEESKQRFTIDNLDQAVWADGKIKKELDTMDEISLAADKQIARLQQQIDEINQWRDNEIKKHQESIDFFEFLLEEYFYKAREDGGINKKGEYRVKSIKLPHITLKMRKQPDRYDINREELIPYLETHKIPDALVITKNVMVPAIKKWIKGTGEKLPGVTITPQCEKFSIVPNK